jgi:lipid-A-disaccharide synthase
VNPPLQPDRPVKLFLLAGEPSGDLLGGRLMTALRRLTGDQVEFSGVGGEKMAAEGLTSLFPMAEISLFGVFEILPKLLKLRARVLQTVAAVLAAKPDALVTIDSPGFNQAVAKRVRAVDPSIKLIHYVAPTVWAWKPKRAAKYAGLFDQLLTLLPFEPPYFTKEGLDCVFVGHSVIESGAGRGNGAAFRARHGVGADQRIVTFLPGSRRGEVSRLLPIFAETAAMLRRSHGPGVTLAVPTMPAVAATVRAAAATWALPALVVEGDGEKFDAFAASEAALAASGTVSLELALARLPTVICYRLNPLTVALYRRFVRVRYVNLVNLMLDRMSAPELLQQDCRADLLHRELARLLDDPAARAAQIADVAAVAGWLGEGEVPPSERAARAVLATIGDKEESRG